MPNRIKVVIPNEQGKKRTLRLGRKRTYTAILFAAAFPVALGLVGYSYNQSQTQLSSTEVSLTDLQQEKALLEAKLEEQVNVTHDLSQELEEKRDELQLLSKRVNDVETVLGLTDEELYDTEMPLAERIDAAAIDSAVRATMLRLIPNDSPVTYQRVSSSYGRRTNPISGKRQLHTGIDLTCKTGEQILAPADGVIETVRPSRQGYGNYMTVRHSFGFMSSYAHLHKFKAKSGQFVSKGDVIATCGNSGNSTGPHLHYEVRFLGRTLNPQYFIDWSPENFDYVFEKEKKVQWAPLIDLVGSVVKLQINLTNAPYVDSSIKTAVTEDTTSETSEQTN
ncbi:M23 family metallopeptidase [Vibrio barjaei]|uniref:Peptidoglycan DD-metalloendopeptidase family protein n=1 Tax=Vibrio barjaei TaxID=1676683 RepID=A0ABW7IBD3_9VIBR|nr:M23 family metallopeptidase [Vibrio barjaei]OIN29355.1 peptidase M23 [Vibrio barjaei]